jgi:hypothetical protein
MLTYPFLSWPHAPLLLLHLLRLKRTLLLMQVVSLPNLSSKLGPLPTLPCHLHRRPCSLQLLANHTKAKDLATTLNILLRHHQTELENFSKEHDTKLEYIQKLTSQSSHYMQKRAVTIQNVKMHAKLLEVNGAMCYTTIIIINIQHLLFKKTLALGKESR